MHVKEKLGAIIIATLFVACPTDPGTSSNFSVGGNVTGLTGSGLVLQNNAADNLNVTANGSFTFAKTLADGTAYTVTVLTQPINPNQTCTPTKNTGVIASTNMTNVVITCTTPSSGSNVITSIGTTGGTATGNYGAQIIIPAGALPSTLEIGMARDSTNAPAFSLPDIDFAGAPYELTPHGTTFAVPVTVRIPFDPAQVPDDAVPTLYKAEIGGTFAAIPTTVDGNMLIASISNFSWVLPAYVATRPRNVYALQKIGSPAVLNVASFKINAMTGVLTGPTSTAPTGDSPKAMVAHPSGRFLYISHGGTGVVNGVNPNNIQVYQLDSVKGNLTGPTSSVGTDSPSGPVAMVIHPSGKFLYVVNQEPTAITAGGNILRYLIDGTTGALSEPTTVAGNDGNSPTAIAFNPAGTLAFIPYSAYSSSDFGGQIKMYSVNPTTGALTGPIGNGSTDNNTSFGVAVEPYGKFAYVISPSGNQILAYFIDSVNGYLFPFGHTVILGNPSALATDSFGRFVYVGRKVPDLNVNLLSYRINPNNGGLLLSSEVLTSCVGGGCVGAVTVIADPQGQFVYATDFKGGLSAFQVNITSGALTASGGVTNVIFPTVFAVTGSSPVWQNNCTTNCTVTYPNGGIPFCCTTGGGSSGGSSGGGTNQNPPTKHYLTVTRGALGGLIVSSPPGIKYGDPAQGNSFAADFPTGSTVQLSVTPPSTPAQAYDVTWSGSCSGTLKTTSVQMNSDKTCHVELMPR